MARADRATRCEAARAIARMRARPTRSCSRTATARRSARWRCSRRSASRDAPALPLDVARRDDAGRDRLPAPAGARRASTRRCRPRPCSRACSWPTTTRRFAAEPTKPIGAVLRRGRGAARWPRERGWHVAPDAGRGWRRMVPSPRPLRILERRPRAPRWPSAASLVIAAGGGGIPVARRDGQLVGARRASIDKDRCAAELAVSLERRPARAAHRRAARGARLRHARQRDVALRLTVSDALRHLDEGEFPPGSMGPEDRGARRASSSRRRARAVITDAAHLADRGARATHGTWIVPDDDGPSVFGPRRWPRELAGPHAAATATPTACG